MTVSNRTRLTRGLAAVALAAAAVSPAVVGDRAAAAAPEPEEAFSFTDDRIEASSGLAVSAAEPDYVFTMNDHGPTRVFGVTPENGRSAATMRLDNAENVDWEAIAAGKGRSLWVGDIGDNESSRPNVTVYRFKLPEPVQTGHYNASAEYELGYPDGAHDAETLLVNPKTNALYVVTKDAKGGALYKAPTPLQPGGNELKKISSMPPLITDGAFRPDGEQFVLRSYTTAYVYETSSGKQLGSFALPKQEQGEGITYTSDGESFLLSSEGAGSAVLRLGVEEALATASKPPASKTPAPEKSDDAGGGSEDGGIDLANALFIAGPFAIALLAAAAAYFLHRRRTAPAGAHGGGGGRRGERRFERDEPMPPPAYGAVPGVADEDDGWPVPTPPRRPSDFEDTQIGAPPSFVEEGAPPPAFTDRGAPPSFQENGAGPAYRENGVPSYQENGVPSRDDQGGSPYGGERRRGYPFEDEGVPSYQDHGPPRPHHDPGDPQYQENGAAPRPTPAFRPEGGTPPAPGSGYQPEPSGYQNGTPGYQPDAGPAPLPPGVPPPPPGGDHGGGRTGRRAQGGRRGGRSGQGKRRRGRGDDGNPFWLRE